MCPIYLLNITKMIKIRQSSYSLMCPIYLLNITKMIKINQSIYSFISSIYLLNITKMIRSQSSILFHQSHIPPKHNKDDKKSKLILFHQFHLSPKHNKDDKNKPKHLLFHQFHLPPKHNKDKKNRQISHSFPCPICLKNIQGWYKEYERKVYFNPDLETFFWSFVLKKLGILVFNQLIQNFRVK